MAEDVGDVDSGDYKIGSGSKEYVRTMIAFMVSGINVIDEDAKARLCTAILRMREGEYTVIEASAKYHMLPSNLMHFYYIVDKAIKEERTVPNIPIPPDAFTHRGLNDRTVEQVAQRYLVKNIDLFSTKACKSLHFPALQKRRVAGVIAKVLSGELRKEEALVEGNLPAGMMERLIAEATAGLKQFVMQNGLVVRATKRDGGSEDEQDAEHRGEGNHDVNDNDDQDDDDSESRAAEEMMSNKEALKGIIEKLAEMDEPTIRQAIENVICRVKAFDKNNLSDAILKTIRSGGSASAVAREYDYSVHTFCAYVQKVRFQLGDRLPHYIGRGPSKSQSHLLYGRADNRRRSLPTPSRPTVLPQASSQMDVKAPSDGAFEVDVPMTAKSLSEGRPKRIIKKKMSFVEQDDKTSVFRTVDTSMLASKSAPPSGNRSVKRKRGAKGRFVSLRTPSPQKNGGPSQSQHDEQTTGEDTGGFHGDLGKALKTAVGTSGRQQKAKQRRTATNWTPRVKRRSEPEVVSPSKKARVSSNVGVATPVTSTPIALTISPESGEDSSTLDVLWLYSDAARKSQEQTTSFIISYFIKHQFKRSKDAQENLRLCLEQVLLDGLLAKDVHSKCSSGVLETYIRRCREANKCIKNEFPLFLAEMKEAVKRTVLSADIENFVKSVRSEAGEGANGKAKRMGKKKGAAVGRNGERSAETSAEPPENFLATIFAGDLVNVVVDYLRKLKKVCFPFEKAHIIGLMKMAYESMDAVRGVTIPPNEWDRFADTFISAHPDFDFEQ